MAYNAFDAMNESAGSDMYITGGAITVSEYENNMDPTDQKEYENTLLELFSSAYQNNYLIASGRYPNVSFKHWLTTVDGEDWRERAHDYDEARKKGEGSDFMYMGDAGMVENYLSPSGYDKDEEIYLLQSLAHLHTGRVEDLVSIVESLDTSVDRITQIWQGVHNPKTLQRTPTHPLPAGKAEF